MDDWSESAGLKQLDTTNLTALEVAEEVIRWCSEL